MTPILIHVQGDVWHNRQQVKDTLDTLLPGQKVALNLNDEGPSLYRIGLVDLTNDYNLDFYIEKWANTIENVPYKTLTKPPTISHFYTMSSHYWVDLIANQTSAKYRFGLFLGRSTLSRNRILYDVFHRWPQRFLLSKMRNTYNPDQWVTDAALFERLEDWFSDVDAVRDWIKNCPVVSIDNHMVQDQYQVLETSSGLMARSLFEFYPQFNVELVCETFTLGTTFFPTEKTVRPMVGNRPFVVYGPRNFLKNLKAQGFKTFEELWDESYDNFEGPDRWHCMTKLIDRLQKLPQLQWVDLVETASAITQHNRTALKKIIKRHRAG